MRTSPRLRALVADFDGTLTEAGRPEPETLAAISRLRAGGDRFVIATGRILQELLDVFPDALAHADALVCENGAVIVTADGTQRVAAPVPRELDAALRDRGIEFRRGEVLVACRADQSEGVLDAIHTLGLDTQLVFNRSELMLLPAAITKGTGTAVALAGLGLSPHSAVAIGDAENDHHLLNLCEVGAAPANAVAALKGHADLALAREDGEGTVELIDLLLAEEPLPRSERWTLEVGLDPQGHPVLVRAAGASVLVAGRARAGKSYLAGLFAEQLVDQGYDTLVIDPEGDHVGLRHLRGVHWVGGEDLPRHPRLLPLLLGSPMGSAVVDLSHLPLEERVRWLAGVPELVVEERTRCASPHWVVVDEAHLMFNDPARVDLLLRQRFAQFCLVTFLPDLIAPAMVGDLTDVVLLGGAGGGRHLLGRLAEAMGVDEGRLNAELVDLPPSTAVVASKDHGDITRCHVGSRSTPHVRHWHKYAIGRRPRSAFHFRSSHRRRTGDVAASLAEMHDVLRTCDASVVTHHAAHRDLSRWIREVFADEVLADAVADAERRLCDGGAVDSTRHAITQAISDRYLAD